MDSRSVKSVVRVLRKWGYSEYSFALSSTGEWTARDAEWNYLDVPHLNVVHTQADAETLFYTDQATSAILRQRIGPFTLGTVLTIYRTGPQTLAYASAVGPVIMVVESEWADEDGHTATVKTSYRIFTPRGLGFLAPMVKRLLARNYEILMSEDLPLRERKGRLRQRGYTFAHDEAGHSFLASQDLRVNNVCEPKHSRAEWRISLSDLTSSGEVLVGSDDAAGIRLKLNGSEIVVLPRMCRHEGACLDGVMFNAAGLKCPWHGRVEKALGRIAIEQAPKSVSLAGGWTVSIMKRHVLVEYSGSGFE